RPSVAAGDLPACLVRARAALGPEGGRITVFTDAARHSWPAGARLELGGAQVRVVRPDDQAPPNRAVRALTARAAPEAGPRAVAIEWEAEVFGATAPVATGAALWVDGAAVARADVELVPGSPTRRRFTHVLPKGADPFHELAVRLDADAYALDDVLMLPVQAPREVQVLVVDGDPQTVAWRDEVFYLERALAASPPGGGTLQQRVLTTAPTVADIDAADVILLCNVRNLPREAVGALERHVERGGGLLISGGDRVDVDFYNGALGGLLPQPLRGEKSRVELEDPAHREVLGIGAVDTSHPVFAPFNGERPEGLARAQTHTVLLLEPGSRAERQVLMRFSNQAPALVERRVGAGRVLLWATSIDRDWSDLAIRPGFLPLMQQLVLHLADALDDGRPRHQAVHVPRVIPLPRGASSVAVEAPGGPRTAVPIRAEDTQVSLPAATVTGLHRVFIAPADGPATEIPSERYAAWPPPEESDLVALTDDEIAARLPAGSELVGRGGTDGVPRQPLWSLLLLLLPLALLAEATLARRG
ncbi:MAG: hypothetical protein HY904_19180, partial [Deltaproteobacteria bacterium]|nr:hypothetical protein [Deltaproteobacteria bacterium]